jgi:cytoskeletal protein RodZ
MRTIGQLIHESRIKKRYSHSMLEEKTKIRSEFIKAIEKEEWTKLPEFPVVRGFIKNIAGALDVDIAQASALLRRDYPPKSINTKVNPKPDISEKFTWNPRLTFITGVVIVAVTFLAYLVYQYSNFIKPPALTLDFPQDQEVVRTRKLNVYGKTDDEATIVINNQPTIVKEGEFNTVIEIYEETREVVVVAKSRSGKETTIRRKIIPELGGT